MEVYIKQTDYYKSYKSSSKSFRVMMDTKIKKCCPNCSQLYQIQSTNWILRIPLFLACGHSMCENCVRNILKSGEPVECKICHQNMEVSTSDTALLVQNIIPLYKLFPVNVYMVGELTLQNMQPNDSKMDSAKEYYIDVKTLIKNCGATEGECYECHKPTSKQCQQCGHIICNNCFSKSHKVFAIFQNHVLQNIADTQQKNTCIIHKDQPLNYYCKDCAKPICVECLMTGEESCKTHDTTKIEQVNENFSSEIADLTPKVDETLRRLTKTAVDIGNLLSRIEDEITSSEYMTLLNNIEQHFSKVISLIQNQKNELTLKLCELKNIEKESLQQAQRDIAEGIKKAKTTLNTIMLLDTKKANELNMAMLLEDVKQIVNTPWYLNRDESENPLSVTVNEDLYALLSGYIKLEGDAHPKYKLNTTNELTEMEKEIPKAPTTIVYPPEVIKDVRQLKKPKAYEENVKQQHTFIKEVPKYRSNKGGSTTSLNSINSDSSYKSYQCHEQRTPTKPETPPQQNQQNQFWEGSQELIYVSHIVDPHNLYVQRASQQDKVQELLREFRNASAMSKPSISQIAEGKVYLVYIKADNTWQRCRVLSVDTKVEGRPLYKVFCVDFGSTEVVTINNLRHLSPARMLSPYPIAFKCSLANCEPINGTWTSDDAFLVQNIIDNKRAVIHIRKILSSESFTDCLECDITTFDDGVSLAHALAFHGRARIPKNLSYPKMIGGSEKPKLLINNNDYKQNSVEEVCMTHVVNPDNFFVRKRHHQKLFEKLCEDLDQNYCLGVNAGSVYLPEKGMSCVANVEKCGLGATGAWARAVVLELPGRGRVHVLLPDTGVRALLHWNALRRILPKFTTMRALATECHLAGVTPHKKKWSPGSVSLLQTFKDRFLELHVEESRIHGSLAVTLYDNSDPENVVCINKEMIKHKFAYTFGICRFNTSSESDELVYDNKSPLDEPKPIPKKKNEITVLKRNQSKVDDLEAKDKGPLRLEVKILNCQSPSLIYVSLVHQQKLFNELFEKIQKHFSKNKHEGKENWKVSDRCCALCVQSQTWRRAVILEIEAGSAKVFYSDFACVETVPLSGLRVVPPEFEAVGDAAITCHLCGVVPAIGDEWPSLTKEFLKELLDIYTRVFITKAGNFKNKSMPVELWVYHTIQGGALEPNTSEWRCLNKKIVEQGLGIPDKSEQSGDGDTDTSNTDDKLSFLNITGSIHDWLQIEPMPMKPLSIEPRSDISMTDSTTPIASDLEEAHSSAFTLQQDEPHSTNTEFVSDWLPPEHLPSDEFIAMPTFIDNAGVIYLHDISQQDTLDLIRKSLDVRFKNPDPKAKFMKWTVGEPCIALYFADNNFYRGRVIEVDEETSSCLIHYIDYGNEEICSFENLRKNIALYQIPIQAHKCVLDRIRPLRNNWDTATLDYIHKSIVEKQCYVRVSGKPIDDIVPIELKYDKLWINDHLVDFELAEYKDGTKAIVRKFAPAAKSSNSEQLDLSSEPDYIVEGDSDDMNQSSASESQVSVQMKYLDIQGKDWNDIMQEDEHESDIERFVTFPSFADTEFLCNITVLYEINKLELSVVQDHETTLMYEKMSEQLQSESNETALNGIYENKACLALFPEDAQWYRAMIMQYSEAKNLVKVKYVDYGKIEVISLNNVREISDEYLKLPTATVTATLYGVQVNPSLDEKSVAEKFTDTFLDKGPFHAKVIDPQVIPSVELTDADGTLIYENLIKEEVLLKISVDND